MYVSIPTRPRRQFRPQMTGDFYRWLANQSDRADPIGDLAKDARRDPDAPINARPAAWRSYLRRHPGACLESRAALEAAIVEFHRGAP